MEIVHARKLTFWSQSWRKLKMYFSVSKGCFLPSISSRHFRKVRKTFLRKHHPRVFTLRTGEPEFLICLWSWESPVSKLVREWNFRIIFFWRWSLKKPRVAESSRKLTYSNFGKIIFKKYFWKGIVPREEKKILKRCTEMNRMSSYTQIFWEISIDVIHPSIKPIVDEGKECTSWSITPGVFSEVV